MILPPLIEGKDDSVPGVLPLTQEILFDSKSIAQKIAKHFEISGPFNIQLILTRDSSKHSLSVIECNLRASRSLPFVSKVLDLNFVDIATKALVNDPYIEKTLPKTDLMQMERNYKGVKVPVFSWTRLSGADPTLGVIL